MHQNYEPVEFSHSRRESFRCVLHDVFPDPEHEKVNVAVPTQFGDICVEQHFVLFAHILRQGLLVLARELPFVQSEKLSGFGCHAEPLTQLQHAATLHQALLIFYRELNSIEFLFQLENYQNTKLNH